MSDQQKLTLEVPTYLDKPETLEITPDKYGKDDLFYAIMLTCFVTIAMFGFLSAVLNYIDAEDVNEHPKYTHELLGKTTTLLPTEGQYMCKQNQCGIFKIEADDTKLQYNFNLKNWVQTNLSHYYWEDLKKVDYLWFSSYWDKSIERTLILTNRSKWGCNKERKELAHDYSDQYSDTSDCTKINK